MKKLLLIVLFFSLLSSLGHFYLAKRAYQLETGTAEQSQICNIGETVNCDSALLSPYAKIFGLPLSNFGLSFNLILSLLLIVFLVLGAHPYWKKMSFYLAGAIALSSVAMIAISLIYRLFCPICWALYVFSFLVLGGLFWAFKDELDKSLSSILKTLKQKNTAMTSASLLLAGLFFHISFINHFDLKDQKEFLNAQFQDWQYAEAIKMEPVFLLKKESEDSNMLIVEFADLLCPACKRTQPALKKFLKLFPDVNFHFYVYPLDGTCNSSIEIKKTGLSCELSKSLICADKQDKGWLIQDMIFEKQNQFLGKQGNKEEIKSLMEKLLAEAQINKSEFDLCMQNPQTLEKVKLSAQAGEKAQITGTPSFFINGKSIPYSSQLLILKPIYEHLH